MQIIDVQDSGQWEKVLSSFNEVSFLQSWQWGEFQKQLGNKVARIQVLLDGKNFSAAQYYIVKSKITSFLYCPRGPLANHPKAAEKLVDFLIGEAKKNRAVFLQIEPDNLDSLFLPVLQRKGFIRQSPIQPHYSLNVALKASMEEIYANLRKTTRSEIQTAKKEGVVIKSYDKLADWEVISKLFLQTSARQKVNLHSSSYIKNQFNSFLGKVKLYTAQFQGKILASSIILSYRKTSTYLHAASSFERRNLGVSHLMVWVAIEDAKKYGDNLFDMWGVAPPNIPNHRWAGITVFKQGFGGVLVSYPEAFILPVLKTKFKLYQFLTYLRALPIFKTIQRILLKNSNNG